MRTMNKITLIGALIIIVIGLTGYVWMKQENISEKIISGEVSKLEDYQIRFKIRALRSAPAENAALDKVIEEENAAIVTDNTEFFKFNTETGKSERASRADIKVGSQIVVYYENEIDLYTFEAKRIQIE